MIFLTSPAAFSVRVTLIESSPLPGSVVRQSVEPGRSGQSLPYHTARSNTRPHSGLRLPDRAMAAELLDGPGHGLDREVHLLGGREPAQAEPQAGPGHVL